MRQPTILALYVAAIAGTNYSAHCHTGWSHLCQSDSTGTIAGKPALLCSTGTMLGKDEVRGVCDTR